MIYAKNIKEICTIWHMYYDFANIIRSVNFPFFFIVMHGRFLPLGPTVHITMQKYAQLGSRGEECACAKDLELIGKKLWFC